MAHLYSSIRDVPLVRPRSVRLVDVRRFFTWSILWRLFMAFLMCSLYVLGTWSGIRAAKAAEVGAMANTNTTRQLTRMHQAQPLLPSDFLGYGATGATIGQNSDGRLEVFSIGSDHNLYHMWQRVDNDTTGWTDILPILPSPPPVNLQGKPAVGRNSDGRLEVFALGSDGNLYHIYQCGTICTGSWSNWGSLGGSSAAIKGNVAVGTNKDGRLELFMLGANNALYHNYQCSTSGCTGGWSGWQSLGTPSSTTGLVNSTTVASNSDGRLEVFALGSDGNLYHIYQCGTVCTGAWSSWSSLGKPAAGLKADPVVGTNSDGRLEVFSLGQDSNLYHIFQCGNICTTIWSSWGSLGGSSDGLNSTPAAGRDGAGHINVFSIGTNGELFYDFECSCSGSWNGVTELGAYDAVGLQGIPAVNVNGDGRLEVITMGTDQSLQDDYQCKSGNNCVWNGIVPLLSLSPTAVDGLGERSFYKFFTRPITARTHLRVNVASANLVFDSTDLQIQGTGLNLDIESFYNSLVKTATDLGNGWVLNTGADVHLRLNGDGSLTFKGPGGYSALFIKNSDGTYAMPPNLNATLTHNSDGTYSMSYHKTGEVLTFSAAGLLTKDADKNGNAITFQYNASNQLTSLIDTQQRSVTFSYNAAGFITTITDPTGRTVTYGYDTTTNNLTSVTDTNGKTIAFAYSNRQLTQITDPLGNVTKISYSSNDQVASVTEATGAVTSFTYDLSMASACSGIVSPALPCTVVTDANTHTTTFAYNNHDQVTGVKDANGNLTTTAYTTDYNVASFTDALSKQTTFQFSTDGKNNLTSVTDGGGALTTFGYTNTSFPYFPSSLTDTQGNTTNFGYDSHGNLNSSTNAATGVQVTSTYNANGTLASTTDGNGHTTTYAYDSRGNLAAIHPPSPLGSTTLTVDSLSRVTSVKDGKGQTTSFTYDKLDRATKITYNNGATISYTYDADGNTTSVVDNTGTTTFTYDAVNRQVKKTLPSGQTISSSFDPVGNMTAFTDGGGTVSYAYTAVNLLSTLTEPGGFQTTFNYDKNYRRTQTSYPNGVTMVTGYDGAGNITSITSQNGATVYARFSYVYTNGSGKQTTLRQSMTDQNGNKTTYTYDSFNRLTKAQVTNSSGTLTNEFDYGYDNANNRTSSTSGLNAQQISYTYNAANELTSSSLVSSYTYDGNGNLTGSSGGPSYSYNAKNQTTAIGSTSFTYTGPDQNERVQENSTSYITSALGLSSMTNSAGTTYYTRDNRGLLIGERTPYDGRLYYTFDGLGSIVGVTDSDGTLEGNTLYSYDPYGTLLSQSSDAEFQNNPWRFAGGFFDSSTNLYKFGIRYDDTSVGRWTQRMPVGGSLLEMTQANPYACTQDDPVNVVDPSGRQNVSVWCGGAAAGVAIGLLLGTLVPLIASGAGIPLIWFALLVAAQSPDFLIAVAYACIGGVVASWVASVIQQATS